VIVEQGGNHRFENLPDYLPRIAAFLEAKPLSTPDTQGHREQSGL
jgi:hypothetical protein